MNTIKTKNISEAINKSDFSKIAIFCIIVYVLSKLLFLFEFSIVGLILNKTLSVIDTLWHFDSSWYQKIAETGYDLFFDPITQGKDGMTWPFFPMWPILIKVFSLNTLLPVKIVGLLLNQFILLSSMFVFYLYLERLKFSTDDIKFTLIAVAVSPANLFFNSGLTENLFLLLSLLAFYYLTSGEFLKAAIIAGFMSATRMTGAFFIIPLIYAMYTKKKLANIIPLCCICLSGLFLFMIYMKLHTGDALAFLDVDSKVSGFARPGLIWDSSISEQIHYVFTRATIFDFWIFMISFFLISGTLIYKKFYAEALFNLCCIIPIVISGSLWCTFRYTTCLFTFYLGTVLFSTLFKGYKDIIQKFIIATFAMISLMCIFYSQVTWYFD